jgi:hypothetical protein
MAKAFQAMLERFGVKDKVQSLQVCYSASLKHDQQTLAINADNASCNDTQTTELASMDNSFEEVNRVRCFNHTLQLSSRSLLKPFNVGLAKVPDDEVVDGEDDDMPSLEDIDDEDEDEDGEDEAANEERSDDDGIDELEELTEEERAQLLADTAAVRTMVTKVCPLL